MEMMLGGLMFDNQLDYETMCLLALTNRKLKNIVQPRLTSMKAQWLLCIEAQDTLMMVRGWWCDVQDSDIRACRHEAFMVRVYNLIHELVIEVQPRVGETGLFKIKKTTNAETGMFKIKNTTKWLGYCNGIVKAIACHSVQLH